MTIRRPPRFLLRQNVRLQQPQAVRHPLLAHHAPHRSPGFRDFAQDLDWFAAVCRVVRGLRRLRIGAIGARPSAFNTVRYSEKLLEATGISVEPIDLSEILGRIHRMKDTEAAAKLDAIRKYVTTDQVPPSPHEDGQTRHRHRHLDEQTQVSISAIQCWTSLEEFFGVVPCTVMSMMSDNLMSSACEVDIAGVVGMHALQLASETPSALLDWNNNYGDDPDKAVCFHCSNLPKHFFKIRQDGLPGDHRRHRRHARTLSAPATASSRPAP